MERDGFYYSSCWKRLVLNNFPSLPDLEVKKDTS